MEKVTLYIPCFNAARFMDRVLPAVLAQTWPIEELLIVDDDASDDDMAGTVRRLTGETGSAVRVVSAGRSTGLAHARNVGVGEARTPFVASLDADCVPGPAWLETLMKGFSSDDVAGVCGRLVETQLTGPADRWRDAHARQEWGSEKITNPLFLFGHGNVFRTEMIRAVGGYDERLVRAGEDHDISRKLSRAGYTLLYDPAAVCGHLRTDTVVTLMKSHFQYGNWSARKGLANMAGKVLGHVRLGIKHMLRDITRGDLDLLPISALYPVWMIFSEMKQRLDGSLG